MSNRGAGTPQCDSDQQGTVTLEHLHSYNIFNVEVFQGSGIRVLPFVTLDDNLLHDPVQQQPVLDGVAASFICREGRGQSDVSTGQVVTLLGTSSVTTKPWLSWPLLGLTRHLETVVQDGHKVRVRLAVRQPLPRQLEHLSCTFGVNVDLWAGDRQGQATHCSLNSIS